MLDEEGIRYEADIVQEIESGIETRLEQFVQCMGAPPIVEEES